MDSIILEQGDGLIDSSGSLSPLPTVLRRGLTAVCIFGFLSLISSSFLLLHLIYRLSTWKERSQTRANQFVILIFNLILADIQQSIAFLLNVEWVRQDAVLVGKNICWSQGWFISTGDLASGIFTLAIAVHSFCDIVWNYRLSRSRFILVLIGLWTFVYACAVIGLAVHPRDLYTRAGAWCWINKTYLNERLWLHYIWVIIAEFGTLIIYALIFMILRKRVRDSYYTTSDTQLRAESAAKFIIAYPIVYVVCTIPLVIARLKGMANIHVSFLEYCIAGAMITSNGWLDVLLYSITRRAVIFGPELTNENINALDTFTNSNTNWRADATMGNTTTIQATNRRPHFHQRLSSRTIPRVYHHRRSVSEDEICSLGHRRGMSVVQTVEVTRSDAAPQLVRERSMRRMSDGNLKGRISFDITETSLENEEHPGVGVISKI